MKVHLAVDLGAGSGRVLAGKVIDGRLELEELHRFKNPGTLLPDGLHWNILQLYRDILQGIRLGVRKFGTIASLGIDTWAVDYGLLDAQGSLLGFPYQYRDARTKGMEEKVEELVGFDCIYEATGIMPFFLNTSVQLLAEKTSAQGSLQAAERFLMIPDLLAYWLTGRKVVEKTNASTTQLFDPKKNEWAWEVIEGLGLPRKIFGEVVEPGTVIGNLRPEVVEEVGGDMPVVAVATHDTASAVAGIPGEGDWAFVSSGTWSIIGSECPAPIITKKAREVGFANEQGVEGTTRFLKNISGLWLIQECKRAWEKDGRSLAYDEMAKWAAEAEGFTAFVDPDEQEFAEPGGMPEKIQDFCRRTGQRVPETHGEILRVASDSIALKHSYRFRQLKELTGRACERIYMGGGGIQNPMLVQDITDACGVPVIAGPVEATACGNLLVQMVATGSLADVAEGREMIRRSVKLTTYRPENTGAWEEAMERFKICSKLPKFC